MSSSTLSLLGLLLLTTCVAVSLTQVTTAQNTSADPGVCVSSSIPWNPSATLRFALSLSLRKADMQGNQFRCGLVSQEALQLYVASQWVCERLNAISNITGTSYVPGLQFGFDLLDDCRSTTRAVQFALEYVDLDSDCKSKNASSTSSIRLGIVGPSRSSTAEELADTLRSTKVPIISPSATLDTLTEGVVKHPNFFRTVPSDKLQIRAMAAILSSLKWTFVAAVYTDDSYGKYGHGMLKTEARAVGVCINTSIAISNDVTIVDAAKQLMAARQRAVGNSLAVVFIGEKDRAEQLFFNLKQQYNNMAKGFHFIMSDSIGINTDAFDNTWVCEPGRCFTIAQGTLSMSPSSVILNDFEAYLNKKYDDVKAGRVIDDVIKGYVDKVALTRVSQIPFVPLLADAVFALAEAARLSHAQYCRSSPGACANFRDAVHSGDILTRLSTLKVNFTAMDSTVAPKELRDKQYILEFDANGDVVPKEEIPDYTIYTYDNISRPTTPFWKVGSYSNSQLNLDISGVKMMTGDGQLVQQLQTSVCSASCLQCADNGKIPLALINGSAYLLGIFSIHERDPNNPFQCGKFRNVSSDVVVLEAFLHVVQRLRASTGLDIGAIAFDDCYSALHITSTLTDFMSGLVPADKDLFEVSVSPDQVVAVVGSLSSDSTMAIASFSTQQNLPSISYASSSPDLDDDVNYPYFLRTVPSDELQAEAMVELILAMGWKYVGLLYVSNNYGTKGAQAFHRIAFTKGICVAKNLNISVIPTNSDRNDLYDVFVDLRSLNVQVVVFFGIDSRMADMIRLIEMRTDFGEMIFIASEDWGTKSEVLSAGVQAARGSLTFKVDNTFIDTNIESSLRTRLLEKRPNSNDNPWFTEFMQHTNDCNFPGGFSNIFHKMCSFNVGLTTSKVDNLMTDQRVKHVMNAAMATIKGLTSAKTKFCPDAFPCDALRQNPKEVYKHIKAQTVAIGSKEENLFDEQGNGNIGFSIYNIQRSASLTSEYSYEYVKVGSYMKHQGLELSKEKILFYDREGNNKKITATCNDDTCRPFCPSVPDPVITPTAESTDGKFRVADWVIVLLLIVLCLVLLVLLVLGFLYFRKKVRGLTKDLQEHKEPIYYLPDHHPQHAPVTYHNLPGLHSHPLSLPNLRTTDMHQDRIQFVNSMSRNNSPGTTLDGRTNPAFFHGSLSSSEIDIPHAGASPHSRNDNNLHPRKATPPPPPPVPTRPFHHSLSAPSPRLAHAARLNSEASDMSSAQHRYYVPHSDTSHRELPAVPDPQSHPQSSRRNVASLHVGQDDLGKEDGSEHIALRDLSPRHQRRQYSNKPQARQTTSTYLHHSDEGTSDYFTGGGSESSQTNIQYFCVDPSGRLATRPHEDHEGDWTYGDREGESEGEGVMTYSLSPTNTLVEEDTDEDMQELNTYSVKPQQQRCMPSQYCGANYHDEQRASGVEYSRGVQSSAGDYNTRAEGYTANTNLEETPQLRSSSALTDYKNSLSSQKQPKASSEAQDFEYQGQTYPWQNGSFNTARGQPHQDHFDNSLQMPQAYIQPLRITPEMRQSLLQQILLEATLGQAYGLAMDPGQGSAGPALAHSIPLLVGPTQNQQQLQPNLPVRQQEGSQLHPSANMPGHERQGSQVKPNSNPQELGSDVAKFASPANQYQLYLSLPGPPIQPAYSLPQTNGSLVMSQGQIMVPAGQVLGHPGQVVQTTAPVVGNTGQVVLLPSQAYIGAQGGSAVMPAMAASRQSGIYTPLSELKHFAATTLPPQLLNMQQTNFSSHFAPAAQNIQQGQGAVEVADAPSSQLPQSDPASLGAASGTSTMPSTASTLHDPPMHRVAWTVESLSDLDDHQALKGEEFWQQQQQQQQMQQHDLQHQYQSQQQQHNIQLQPQQGTLGSVLSLQHSEV